MAQAPRTGSCRCPGCRAPLPAEADGASACSACGWRGEVYRFRPLPVQAERPQEALPDDAVCVHHPTKRAVAVCEGSGDYICSLCAVEIDRRTYSAQYLDGVGEQTLQGASQRYLERPDRQLGTCLLLSVVFWPAVVVTIPLGIAKLVKAVQLRRKDRVFRRLVARWQVASAAAALTVLCFAIVAIAVMVLLPEWLVR